MGKPMTASTTNSVLPPLFVLIRSALPRTMAEKEASESISRATSSGVPRFFTASASESPSSIRSSMISE